MGASSEKSKDTRIYVIGAGLIGGSALLLSVLASPFLLVPAMKKLGNIPWMSTPPSIIRLALGQIPRPSLGHAGRPKFIDLGSGDGRVVIEAAKAGYQATGIELNPVLLSMSYYNSWRAGVLPQVHFKMTNFWHVDVSDFDVIALFGVPPAMNTFKDKVQREGKPGAHMVCFRFPIENLQPSWQEGELYVYKKD